MEKKSKAGLIAKLIVAPIAYFLITQIVSTVYIVAATLKNMTDPGNGFLDYTDIYNMVIDLAMDKTMLLTLISAVITIPLIYFVFFDKKEKPAGKKISLLYAALFGIGVSIVANVIVALSGVAELSETYQELSNYIYTGNILLELFAAGIAAPVVEELIYRGVIMKNLYKLTGMWPALLISSLIFGAMHGNLVQFVYASLLGLAMGFVYIRYQKLIAPILFHMAANTFSVLISDWDWMADKMENPFVSLGIILICLVLTVVCPILILKNTGKINVDEEIPQNADIE